MTRPVVLCADDYGMSRGISEGIVRLAEAGRLSATSAMVNGPYWAEGAGALRDLAGRVGTGLHLTLTWGAPLGVMPETAPGGVFPRLPTLIRRALTRRLELGEIEAEIGRQITAFADAFGREPDFVDGHQHVHALPGIRGALFRQLARRGLAGRAWIRDPTDAALAILRRRNAGKAMVVAGLAHGFRSDAERAGFRTNEGFSGFSSFADADVGRDVSSYLDHLGPRPLVMCHPGLVHEGEELDGVVESRGHEYRYLASPDFPALLASRGVSLAPAP